jgi:hypothetical protein
MAGIEKVCEYSGDYPGGAMYGYKYKSIQVCPEYLGEFAGREATLFVWKSGLKATAMSNSRYWMRYYGNERRGGRCEYSYCLYVPSLPGRVRGYYHNDTCDIRGMKRRIRKILGLRSNSQLSIKRVRTYDDVLRLTKTTEG